MWYFNRKENYRVRNFYTLILLIIYLVIFSPHVLAIPTTLYNHGEPTDFEQYMLELINRARANPSAEGLWLEDYRQTCPENFTYLQEEFASYPVAPPLATNAQLLQAARLHSQDMLQRDYFEHNTPEGLSPGDRIENQGYTGGWGENIYSGGASTAEDVAWYHAGFLIDCGIPSLGHRLNILKSSFNEVGIGNVVANESGRITQDFGIASDRIFLLGVVYQDQNGNNFYDPGEGVSNVTVMPSEGEYYAITSSSGGYAIPFTATETRELEVPTSLAYDESTSEQRWNEYQTFRDSYAADSANQVRMPLQVSFSGGTLDGTVTKEVTLIQPILVDAKFVYAGGSWWMSPFLVGGTNVKLDVDISKNDNHSSQLPTLGQNFNGGISVNHQAYQAQATLNLSDRVAVSGDILVDDTEVSKVADIFVYAEATIPPSDEVLYFMLGEGLTISVWDKNPENLVAFQPDIRLSAMQSVPMYSGQFIYSGTLKVFFGYRLADGTLVQNSQPIDIVISD